MGPSAQAASAASGVPAPLILAQAALESGWGKREIRADDGTQSFNLFGIKADRGWKGPVVEITTTEYVDGEPQKVRAKFRAYASYDEAFADYASFITRNPRYANVLATDDPAQAAHGLQRAGYATDPQYGHKLVRIMQKFG
jgi:peptidoglycan hydrolase FlgJ